MVREGKQSKIIILLQFQIGISLLDGSLVFIDFAKTFNY